jgi:hypothetical protein
MFKTYGATTDRGLRSILGRTLINIVFMVSETPRGWTGLAPLASGLIGWCPLYTLPVEARLRTSILAAAFG